VVILCGDVPLLTTATVEKLIAYHVDGHRDLTVLAVELADPTGYGRILTDAGRNLRGIVEEADADARQKAIRLINSGIYCVQRDFLASALKRIDSDNAQGELYLTDIVGVGYREKRSLGIVVGDDADEIVGVNSVEDLRVAESLLRKRRD
jgi:bifunctional N-acetylglucosamine-1-phosphate-uridyltransferase/glucosamine-1-phosphate-acetyltransferase GlmU-like protein